MLNGNGSGHVHEKQKPNTFRFGYGFCLYVNSTPDLNPYKNLLIIHKI